MNRYLMTMMLAGSLVVGMGTPAAAQSDLTNWIQPYGFSTPDLRMGQYSFQTGTEFSGYRSRWYYEYESDIHRERTTEDEVGFRVGGIYALTDQVLVRAHMFLAPPQNTGDSHSQWDNDQAWSTTTTHIDRDFHTSMAVVFKPWRLSEMILSWDYSENKRSWQQRDPRSNSNTLTKYYSVFIGFNVAN